MGNSMQSEESSAKPKNKLSKLAIRRTGKVGGVPVVPLVGKKSSVTPPPKPNIAPASHSQADKSVAKASENVSATKPANLRFKIQKRGGVAGKGKLFSSKLQPGKTSKKTARDDGRAKQFHDHKLGEGFKTGLENDKHGRFQDHRLGQGVGHDNSIALSNDSHGRFQDHRLGQGVGHDDSIALPNDSHGQFQDHRLGQGVGHNDIPHIRAEQNEKLQRHRLGEGLTGKKVRGQGTGAKYQDHRLGKGVN